MGSLLHPGVTAIITTFKRPRSLASTLDCLVRCQPAPPEVLVVDGDPDRSARPVVEAARATAASELVYIPAQTGSTRQRNTGIEAARGEFLVFVDDDAIVERDAFARLMEAYRDPAVVGVTGRVVERDRRGFKALDRLVRDRLPGGGRRGTFTRFGYPRYPRPGDPAMDVEFMYGCFMSCRRSALGDHRFDETLTGYGLMEDQVFSYDLARRGRLRYVPEIPVYHRRQGFDSFDHRAFNRLVIENRWRFFRSRFPQTRVARAQFFLFLLVLLGHRVLNRELAGARGLVDGWWDTRRR